MHPASEVSALGINLAQLSFVKHLLKRDLAAVSITTPAAASAPYIHAAGGASRGLATPSCPPPVRGRGQAAPRRSRKPPMAQARRHCLPDRPLPPAPPGARPCQDQAPCSAQPALPAIPSAAPHTRTVCPAALENRPAFSRSALISLGNRQDIVRSSEREYPQL